jgi:HD-GYP domain-containing protein (c-di-GMP phosphodiesterase class II)
VHLQRPTSIADVYAAADFDFSGTRAFDARNGYRTQSVLTVPLLPRGGAVIGAVQLINARQRDSDEVVPFSLGVERFVQALSAMAATALYNRSLLDAQQALMDSMITSMASAIDAKSPYTGGHCARVPELAMMLAREASAASTGPLAAFRFETEEQWQEFRIGAWLHDCGKVTTPEYVVDKATKLETINNRIHELRTRFEVLLRDVEIARLQAIAAGTDPEAAEAQAAEQRAALADDFAFVAECNVGSEFMDPKRTERLKGIAERTWLRHLDDRLGLSHGELSRIAHLDPAPLPAVERLLADKPEHIIPRSGTEGMFDPRYGFKTTIPKHLYNLGELYNLSISKGTLTEEERFKVNEHIMQTIIMLEHLSFPAHLKRVPEYAGSHHETMIGTGYPRGLNAEQLSVPSRIMAIADIFEALTAADRPYKKPKTLSEAVQILWFFVKDRHIDPDLFRLFLESGIYRRYGEAFLRPEQIDEVNIAKYLAPVAVLSN